MEPKWGITRPAETPASEAMARTLVAATPSAANQEMAASRMRAAVERSSATFGIEHMFNILHERSAAVKGFDRVCCAYTAEIARSKHNERMAAFP